MSSSHRRIAAQHRQLRGRLIRRRQRSAALGLAKPYYVYEPPGLSASARELPVVYLFRGHEREWVNMQEDDSRDRSTAVEDIDRAIHEGLLPPMLVVMPGLNSADNHVPSLGIDMAGTWSTERKELGSGRFWTYLTAELFPVIEARYPQIEGGLRLAAGFSLGGYTVSLLAAKHPGYFDHIASYDGLLMWPRHQDPRVDGNRRCGDPVWCRASIFDPALGRPRSARTLDRWNPTDALFPDNTPLLNALRETTFWIACAHSDGRKGNRDRARFFVRLLQQHGLRLGFDGNDVIFHPDASHTWHWTDRFLLTFLVGAFTDASPELPRVTEVAAD
jgi:S-formylglutathione hydrolase FrmB